MTKCYRLGVPFEKRKLTLDTIFLSFFSVEELLIKGGYYNEERCIFERIAKD
jgi:hypothetical protein